MGNPDDRFAEGALRIMRAVRFASKYGFEIAESTAESVNKNRERLNNIAAERIQTELVKLLFGKGAENILLEYSDVLSVIIPEIAKCVGFEQNNPHHIFDVYGHTVKAVAAYGGEDVSVKIALLLHDIGKPDCYTEQDGVGHFYGHAKISREIARGVLNRLRFDNKTRSEALELIEYHDDVIELTEKSVRRRLAKMGEARLRQLIEVKKADIKAQTPEIIEERLLHCDKLIAIIDGVVAKEQCFSIKNLAINGRDIISLGAKEGKEIGATLEFLLDKVINGDLKNEADILKAEALKYLTTVQM